MASYKVVFKPSAEKDLRTMPKAIVARVFKRIEALAGDPLPRQSVKLSGSEGLYRIRIGDYRLIYEFEKGESQILIHYIRHRREAYR